MTMGPEMARLRFVVGLFVEANTNPPSLPPQAKERPDAGWGESV